MSGNVIETDMVGFYTEVFHMRGNFSKFEWIPDDDLVDSPGPLELDVWNFRRRDHESWHVGFIIDQSGGTPQKFRITRYPDLEKDVLDAPYHPAIESWNIDPEKVKEHYIGSD